MLRSLYPASFPRPPARRVRLYGSLLLVAAIWRGRSSLINERLKSAITPDVPSVEVSSNVSTEKSVANEEDMQDGNKIVTTDEELMGFYIVRAILCNTVDLDRVVDRDAQSYFAILFDDNNRKPICRLHFNGGKKYVETFDEEKKGTKHLITALTDIYKLSDQLISTVKFYLK